MFVNKFGHEGTFHGYVKVARVRGYMKAAHAFALKQKPMLHMGPTGSSMLVEGVAVECRCGWRSQMLAVRTGRLAVSMSGFLEEAGLAAVSPDVASVIGPRGERWTLDQAKDALLGMWNSHEHPKHSVLEVT